MKKFLIIILLLSMVLLSACSTSDSSESSKTSVALGSERIKTTENYQTESTQIDVDKTEASTSKSVIAQSDNKYNNSQLSTTSENKPKGTEPSKQKQTESKQEKTETTAESEKTTVLNAGASDAHAVAGKVLEYINQYRSVPAVKLSGLTNYAQYRSKQLVSNFAHDTNDQRAAATALQYGEYIDPSQFGGSGDPYYRAGAREAIAKAGFNGTVDQVAEKLAKLVRDSSGHWAYIGSSEYKYIAVGITYQSGMWYCDIAVAEENTDEY
ncbi:MAG: hypothetical protein NC177_17640 [Ruminococcus flavefaciens]|nr:hypothetical protein [Ruminococcus flavefaciens]